MREWKMNTYVSVNKALKDYIKMFKILKCFIYKNLHFLKLVCFVYSQSCLSFLSFSTHTSSTDLKVCWWLSPLCILFLHTNPLEYWLQLCSLKWALFGVRNTLERRTCFLVRGEIQQAFHVSKYILKYLTKYWTKCSMWKGS